MRFNTLLAMISFAGSTLAAPTARQTAFKGIYPIKHVQQDASIAASSSNLVYGGGNLLNNVIVKALYWSSAVTYNYDAFYAQTVTGNPFMSILTQYSESGFSLGSGSALPGYVYTAGATSGTVSVTSVTAAIQSLVSSGVLDPSGGSLYVPVHFPPGVAINANDGTGLGLSCTSWCAYHYSVQTSAGWVYYGIIPDQGTGACAGSCGNGPSVFASTCQVASHELGEAITDPDQQQNGWMSTGGEIGDLCVAQLGDFCGADGYEYYVQKMWSNSAGACVNPSPAPSNCPNGVAAGLWNSVPVPTTAKTTASVVPTTAKTTAPAPTTAKTTTVIPVKTTTAGAVKTTTATVVKTTAAVGGNPVGQPCGTTYGAAECVAGTEYYCGGSAPYTWQMWYVGC
ncbi:hypothetical protein HDU98_007173 [Podochytrium sp. JEL0797]|nr:hypothetical protein HDU98_007173 [Podochytrium sp. JEL0797]